MTMLNRRDIMSAGLTTSMMVLGNALPRSAFAAAMEADRDPFWFVNPELRPAARKGEAMAGSMSPLSAETLPAMRKALASFSTPPTGATPLAKRTIPGGAGQPEVTIYLVNARAGARRPGIVHMHGGGFVSGSALGAIGDLQKIAQTLDCAIVSVEYRLAPETGYAGSIEDNYAALRWLHRNADACGVDPARLAVMGESAGGGHGALLAITARDRGEVPLAFQLLIYPMLDDRTGSTQPVPDPIGRLLWTAQQNRFGWRAFLGQAPGTGSVPSAAVPARHDDLSGLPPTFIGVGSIDLFVEENIDYARRLIRAGITTQLMIAPGAFHGFDGIAPQSRVALDFGAAKIAALRSALSVDTVSQQQ